jgi:hypothetical protein
LRRYYIGTPEEGARCQVWGDHQWRLEPGSDVTVRREGCATVFSVFLPAEVLGLAALDAGLVLDFDLAVQISDASRRRGVLEWVQGFTSPDRPGGRLRLLS